MGNWVALSPASLVGAFAVGRDTQAEPNCCCFVSVQRKGRLGSQMALVTVAAGEVEEEREYLGRLSELFVGV